MELLLILFLLVAVIQTVTQISKVWEIRKFHPEYPKEARPFISVIVAAHNEETNLRTLIPVLINQHYEKYEIIIALDRCTDRSVDYLKSINSEKLKVLSLTDLPEDWNAKKFAIKSAITIAEAEWLLLTDADCQPSPNWLSEMSKAMGDTNGFVIGISPYQKQKGLLNQLIQYETFITSLEFTQKAIAQKPYMALGRNMAYRKSLFLKVGGFEGIENLTGGDDDLLIQKMTHVAKGSIVLDPESYVESIPERTWRNYFKQKTRHFSAGKTYSGRIKRAETFRWTLQFLFWVLFFYHMVANPPLAAVIFALFYTIRIISINIVGDLLEKRFNHLWLPFVDLVYSVVLPIIGLRSLVVKNVKWN